MGSTKLISLLFCPLLVISTSAATQNEISREPCKTFVVYFHDILYNGQNAENATSAIVAAPAWGNKTILAEPTHFGDIIVFDDPITLDNNLHSTPVGRAQGLYLYDGKHTFITWFGFSFLFNSTVHNGILTFAGADPFLEKTREIPVIGGTGDFFMARGIATFMTDAFEGEVYFRVRVNISLYECW
ncbi:disease resistance response protein 206-like [Pistacia vera]|uniref:disease resistance response protein 206-like n=1 Tax=Pistacia vera TaxID=55513 RepID=UPI0012635148|nr:disease resistance response protein 206-like [Pistacia vera]